MADKPLRRSKSFWASAAFLGLTLIAAVILSLSQQTVRVDAPPRLSNPTETQPATPYQVGDFATALGTLTDTTPKFDGLTLTWTTRVIASNDAVALVEVFAVPIKGYTFTRAVGIGGDFQAAQAAAVPQIIFTAGEIGGRCFGLSADEQSRLREWIVEKLREGAEVLGGGVYERPFGLMTQRVRVSSQYDGSARVVLTGLRRDTPGAAEWPTYCVVR